MDNFVELDKHVTKQNRFYPVYSLYFEDFGLSSYHDKLAGQINRLKMRLRFYDLDTSSGLIKTELKYKFSDLYLKRQSALDHNLFQKLINKKIFPLDTIKNPETKRFLMIAKYNNFRPFIRIDYERQALYAKNDKNVRITFDKNVKCSRVTTGNLKPFNIRVLPLGTIILEIKTPNYFPYWLTYIIKKYNLKRVAISKYTLAVQNLATNSSLCI